MGVASPPILLLNMIINMTGWGVSSATVHIRRTTGPMSKMVVTLSNNADMTAVKRAR